MSLQFPNLDILTRQRMLEEFDEDFRTNKVYVSDRLTQYGKQEWSSRLRVAIEMGTDGALKEWLDSPGILNDQEPYIRDGKQSLRKVPVTASMTLAEGEFNRYYVRGLCKRSLQEGHRTVRVVRVKNVEKPRPESVAKEGTSVDAATLLSDVRANVGIDTALGIPAGPNSGLSIGLS